MSLRKTTFIEFLLTPAMHKTTVLLETTSYIFVINNKESFTLFTAQF